MTGGARNERSPVHPLVEPMIAFPPKPPIDIAAIPAGTEITHDLLCRIIAAWQHLGRPLTAEEVAGIIEKGVLAVREDTSADVTLEIGEAGSWPEGDELSDYWLDELTDFNPDAGE